jgi:hypothetical protein
MGQSHSSHKQQQVKEQVFQHPATKCLFDRFPAKTLELMVDPLCSYLASVDLSHKIGASWSRLADTIYDNARQNNNTVSLRWQIIGNSDVYVDFISFQVNSKDDSEVVALQIMIFYGLFLQNDAVIKSTNNQDMVGDKITCIYLQITGPLGDTVKEWFDEILSKVNIIVTSRITTNGKSTFCPYVKDPPKHLVDSLPNGYVFQGFELAGKDTFWKRDLRV